MKTATLRKLYDASFHDGLNGSRVAKLAVSFDDYFEFVRMHAPGVTRRSAAENAMRLSFRPLAKKMPPDPPEAEPPERYDVWLERKAKVDLARTKIDPACEVLTLDRVKQITGWASLRRLRKLFALDVSVCGSTDTSPARPKLRLRSVSVECASLACIRTVLASVDAPNVRFETSDIVNLEGLSFGPKLREVSASAPLIRGVSRLAGHPIEELALSDVVMDDELRSTLETLRGTLNRLFLSSTRAFEPAALGDLSRMRALRRVLIPTRVEDRKAWIDLAVAHPTIGFDFRPFDERTGETCSVEEVHRGVDILRIERGTNTTFEVAGDLAALRKRYRGSNEDLEDELRAIAKTERRKVAWSSESDTFVARTKDVDTSRWLIDHALATRSTARRPTSL